MEGTGQAPAAALPAQQRHPPPAPRASPAPPKLVCSQSRRGHTPHVRRQYCWRSSSVKGSAGKRSVTLLLEKARFISVQACGPRGAQVGRRTPRPRWCRPQRPALGTW